MSAKKIHIKTYGCQMNVYDSERMQDMMTNIGYQISEEVSDSDLVIINTCHIREKASEKLFSDLGRILPHKKEKAKNGEQMIVAVAGCVAQAEGEEIFRRAPVVDIIVGPESYQNLPDLVAKVIRDKTPQINLKFDANKKFDQIIYQENSGKSSAFLTIQEGCDKFCSFCVVPYTRGAEYSRDIEPILQEVEILANNGASEVYLLGQNVNAFRGKNKAGELYDLARLIADIAKNPKIIRIRYTTSHPRDMSTSLIDAHKNISKLMPFLHLPVQSGSNSILKAMNRKHDRSEYFSTIENLRLARPDMGLSSDFIVGFPGETDEDFADTLDLVRKIGFTQCYSFKYSPRPGTPAADAKNQVPEHIKEQRLEILQQLLSEQQIAFNQKFEGKNMPVLFEKESPKSKKQNQEQQQNGLIQLWGKSPWLQSVVLEVPEQDAVKYLGRIVEVHIKKSRPSSLVGVLANNLTTD